MSQAMRLLLAALLVSAIGLVAACGGDDGEGATATDTTETVATTANGGTVSAEQYQADLQETAGSLLVVTDLVRVATDPDAVEPLVPQAEEALDTFDARIREMDGYTVDDAALERQRAAVVAAGPAVSESLREFIKVAEAGDTDALLPASQQMLVALQQFQEAAATS
jgi:hypothetical protein